VVPRHRLSVENEPHGNPEPWGSFVFISPAPEGNPMTEQTTKRRVIRAYCTVPVEGTSYPEMDFKAREYAATFFGVELGDLVISTVPTITVAKVADFSDDPTKPGRWRGTFRVGCLHTYGEGEYVPQPEFPEEDPDDEDRDDGE
jgi:hypothetical protein